MKIGDVKIGEEYAAHDTPASRYTRDLPRQVRVIEVVSQEERRHSAYAGSTVVKKRRVKVEFLDDSKYSGSSYRRTILAGAKGSMVVIEARLILAPWKDIRADIKKQTDNEQKRLAIKASLEARIEALGFDTYVSVSEHSLHPTLRFEGKEVEKILALAEAGNGNR